jgi:2-succinyl-6-hydroxy-2,4-cyclohexadiene-1-carboxylate synthase
MTRIATRDGVAYDVHDRGSGRPMVLLHGFAGSSRTWTPVIEGLGRDRRLLLVDLLGHGGSDAPGPLRHEVERQAADIAWLIDGLADGHADVVGYSFGARVALRLALDTPGVVRRLVLESPSAGLADPQAREARVAADERWASLLDEGDLGAFHDAWDAQPVFASRATLPDEVRAAIREEHLAASARGLAGSLRGAGQGAMEPLQGRLSSMIAATLVVAGDLDPTGTQRAAEVARGIPQARLELVPDAGHAPHLEQPATFVRICNDFFAHSSQGAP